MNKLTAIVVLYNPGSSEKSNIIHHLDLFGHIIAVDNSDQACNDKAIADNKQITYIPLYGNQGIAKALNIGLDEAMKRNERWAMLLDQDSRFSKESLDMLAQDIAYVDYQKTAIVAGNHHPGKYAPDSGVVPPDNNILITSGSVVNTSIVEKEGGMLEPLFIDCVDYEFCFRMLAQGYILLRDCAAVFTHSIGNKSMIKGVECNNYPPMRYFYIARNNSIVGDMYKEKIGGIYEYTRRMLKEFHEMATLEDGSDRKLEAWNSGLRAYQKWLKTREFVSFEQ